MGEYINKKELVLVLIIEKLHTLLGSKLGCHMSWSVTAVYWKIKVSRHKIQPTSPDTQVSLLDRVNLFLLSFPVDKTLTLNFPFIENWLIVHFLKLDLPWVLQDHLVQVGQCHLENPKKKLVKGILQKITFKPLKIKMKQQQTEQQ